MDAVECRSDTEYAERPLSLVWKGKRYEIAEVISRWQGPSEMGFYVTTIDGRMFELTYQAMPNYWHVEPI